MSLTSRLEALEKATPGGDCACPTEPGVSGYRVTHRGQCESASDSVTHCRRCGRARPVIVVQHVTTEALAVCSFDCFSERGGCGRGSVL
jgi:hypothetical protein